MNEQLFDPGPVESVVLLSGDQRRTIRNRALIASGRHPVSGSLLAGNGETCATCAHLRQHRYANTYYKCEYNDTGSAATDIRLGWPACTRWELAGE
jgi:hypothetical protein